MDLLLGTTLFASFLGGVVALLAPCCVSVMLPAYFASTFARRIQIVGMTLVFAAGIGTVIVPVAPGASALSALVSGHHTVVFSIGGLAMVAAGIATLAGRKLMPPMPAMRGTAGHGLGAVYGLVTGRARGQQDRRRADTQDARLTPGRRHVPVGVDDDSAADPSPRPLPAATTYAKEHH